jgi:hypothetical protein
LSSPSHFSASAIRVGEVDERVTVVVVFVTAALATRRTLEAWSAGHGAADGRQPVAGADPYAAAFAGTDADGAGVAEIEEVLVDRGIVVSSNPLQSSSVVQVIRGR